MKWRHEIQVTGALAACLAAVPSTAPASAPVIYSQPAYESPISGGPDSLLLLPGYGFSSDDIVVYRAVPDGYRPLSPPRQIPDAMTTESGVARVVSTNNAPYSLTILLPKSLDPDRVYALTVRNSRREWSNSVTINDSRPLWFTPGIAYSSADPLSQRRILKIVGRNLRPQLGGRTTIRLAGPQRVEMNSIDAGDTTPELTDVVARIVLPPALVPGKYSVEFSRDRRTWIPVAGQLLAVLPDPKTARRFEVGDRNHGACRPNDDLDDTRCVLAAIAAAANAGGGNVHFSAGVWDLLDASAVEIQNGDGIIVPPHVSLAGDGASLSRIRRHSSWNSKSTNATFSLLGSNEVRGLTFEDSSHFAPGSAARPTLQLGRQYDRATAGDNGPIDGVIITANRFDKTFIAIADGGLPISRLFVTHNEFGSYYSNLELGGNRFNVTSPFHIDDSVIAFNTFKPGSHLDLPGKTGVLASELGAGRRVDFSNNIADGTSVDFLYSSEDARGWRAGFFWNMSNNIEMQLVAENTISCAGDKIGDGEAISYDNNGNTFGTDRAATVRGANEDEVTIDGPLVATQNGRPVDTATYYRQHWIQIVEGPGLGQTRKIQSYVYDKARNRVTLTVSPRWDVAPAPVASRITITRQFWQVYTVGNLIDHRRPPCRKSNRGRPQGGGISLWAQTADSLVSGNRQFDTDGIVLRHAYSTTDPACKECVPDVSLQYFVEIHGNEIDGEYRWDLACSQSGITGSYAAGPTPTSSPPVLGYGLSIAHNKVSRADGLGGAISFPLTWYDGPPPHRWKFILAPLLDHNTISEIRGSPPLDGCNLHQPARIGIGIGGPDAVWNSVLHANTCDKVSHPLRDLGAQTVKVCAAVANDACECAGSAH